MKKQQRTYRFHNPNPEQTLEDYIQKIIISNAAREMLSILQNQEQKAEQTTDDFATEGL